MKTKHFLALLAMICLTSTISFAQKSENPNPYAIFGGNPHIAGERSASERVRIFKIGNIAEGSRVARLEHDTETGIVRSYDSDGNVVRERKLKKGERAWPTMDRFAEKYYSISPYAYVANNPVIYTDPTGDTIDVTSILAYDQANGTSHMNTIITDLNAQTGLTFSVSGNKLIYSVDAKGNPVITPNTGSATARGLMMGAVGHADTASAFILTEGGSKGSTGGHTFGINPNQIEDFMFGATGVDSRTMGYGMTFMHELTHTAIGGGLSDSPNGVGNPGPTVTQMNIIRSELNAQGGNYGQRQSYEGFPDWGGMAVIPFSPAALANIQAGRGPAGAPHVRHKIDHRRFGWSK